MTSPVSSLSLASTQASEEKEIKEVAPKKNFNKGKRGGANEGRPSRERQQQQQHRRNGVHPPVPFGAPFLSIPGFPYPYHHNSLRPLMLPNKMPMGFPMVGMPLSPYGLPPRAAPLNAPRNNNRRPRSPMNTVSSNSASPKERRGEPVVASRKTANRGTSTSPPLSSPKEKKEKGGAQQPETTNGLVQFPLIYVSPAGTISIVLRYDVVIEMAVDRSVRVVLHDNFAVMCNARGTSSAILHPNGRILHSDENVFSMFTSTNEKMAVFGWQGVLFTMSHLSEAYLVNSSSFPGASAVSLDQLKFPSMDHDYTIKLFYSEAHSGQHFIPLCKEIVQEATYEKRSDGSLFMHINGMLVRQTSSGEVLVDARPRQISVNPHTRYVHVRSQFVDMALEDNERAYVKRGAKRVHVSRSGMVISDGNCITSMDHFGRIVCCN